MQKSLTWCNKTQIPYLLSGTLHMYIVAWLLDSLLEWLYA